MTDTTTTLDLFLFVVLPYAAIVVFVLGSIERYRRHAYSCSSHSSQFLENRQHFWGVVPFHYGIILVLLGHLVMFAFPEQVLAWNARPWRLYLLEAVGLALGLLALVGLVLVMTRRAVHPRVRAVTSRSDWPIYGLLLVQVATGVQIAVAHSWGSSWFATSAAPYLWSLVLLRPELAFVSVMPWTVTLHIVCAFALVAVFPFSRLLHVLDVPNRYLWRRPQVVRWHRAAAAPGDRS